jgi:hypothetical protein
MTLEELEEEYQRKHPTPQQPERCTPCHLVETPSADYRSGHQRWEDWMLTGMVGDEFIE